MEKLGREAHPVLQVEDDPAVARERVQLVGAQTVRAVRLHLDLAVEAISHSDERPSHHGLRRRRGGPPHCQELPLDERVFEGAASGPRLRAERPDQETPGNVNSPGQAKLGAGRRVRAHHGRRVAELEGECVAEIEVLVPEKVAHVGLDRELGTRELDAGEEKSEAPFLRKRELVGLELDRPEMGLLAPIPRVQAHDRAFPFQGEAASRRQLEEPRVHSEPCDLAPFRVEPGLAALVVVEERASRERVERTESAGEREVLAVAVAVVAVEQVEPEPPTQELPVRVEDRASRTVRLLRRGESPPSCPGRRGSSPRAKSRSYSPRRLGPASPTTPWSRRRECARRRRPRPRRLRRAPSRSSRSGTRRVAAGSSRSRPPATRRRRPPR